IYVAPARADLVRFTNSLVYVLAERDNATDRDFGLLAKPGPQRRIVAQLERTRPRVVVRWTDPLGSRHEPNLRGRPSGVHLPLGWAYGAGTVFMIGLIGRRLAGERAGLLAAVVGAIYLPLVMNDSLLLSESLAGLMIAVVLHAALRFHARPGVGRALWLGAAVG